MTIGDVVLRSSAAVTAGKKIDLKMLSEKALNVVSTGRHGVLSLAAVQRAANVQRN